MRFCLQPRCRERVERGYCDAHRRGRERERRESSAARGYGFQWQARRLAWLAEFPLCGMRRGGVPPVMSACHAQGRPTPATDVDHVEPHRGNESLFWDEGNWQSLCSDCHKRKTQAGQ